MLRVAGALGKGHHVVRKGTWEIGRKLSMLRCLWVHGAVVSGNVRRGSGDRTQSDFTSHCLFAPQLGNALIIFM